MFLACFLIMLIELKLAKVLHSYQTAYVLSDDRVSTSDPISGKAANG